MSRLMKEIVKQNFAPSRIWFFTRVAAVGLLIGIVGPSNVRLHLDICPRNR